MVSRNPSAAFLERFAACQSGAHLEALTYVPIWRALKLLGAAAAACANFSRLAAGKGVRLKRDGKGG